MKLEISSRATKLLLPLLFLSALVGVRPLAANSGNCTTCSPGTPNVAADFCVLTGDVDDDNSCNGLDYCQPPQLNDLGLAVTPTGNDTFKVEYLVEAIAPKNRDNPLFTYPVIDWFVGGSAPAFPTSDGNVCLFGPHDKATTQLVQTGVTCAGGSFGTFSVRIVTCFTGSCSEDIEAIDFTVSPSDLPGCEPDPPMEECKECTSCPVGGRGGNASGTPPTFSPSGARMPFNLAYAGGGVGGTGLPGSGSFQQLSALSSAGLGRYWMHPYAQRIVEDDDETLVWLINESGTFREFTDLGVDNLYATSKPSDEYRTLEWLGAGNGWELRDLDGTTLTFNSLGEWVSTTDRNGNATTANYVSGMLESVSLPDQRILRFAYDGSNQLDTVVEEGLNSSQKPPWIFTWVGDDLDRLEMPDGRAWEFAYDDPAFPGYLTDWDLESNGGSTVRIEGRWEYDAQGRVVATWKGTDSKTDLDVVDLWEFEFDTPTPGDTTATDPLGEEIVYTFDTDPASSKSRVLEISGDCSACGNTPNVTFEYDDVANPLRPTAKIDGRGIRTEMEYDDNGMKTLEREAAGTILVRETEWAYDELSYPAFPTEIKRPSTSPTGSRDRLEILDYDSEGNVETRTVDGYEVGHDGDPGEINFSDDTEMLYNGAGQPESVDPPGFSATDVTSYTYYTNRGDLLVETRTDPLIGTTSFDYDDYNRQVRVTDVNGVDTDTQYDDLNRVEYVIQRGASGTDPSDPPQAGDLATESRYDALGQLEFTILPRGNVIEYGYDDAGRLISIARKPDLVTNVERAFYTLDAFGNRIREEQQRWDGSNWTIVDSSTDYVYTSRCHLDQIVDAEGNVTEYAYDCNGNLESIWDANNPSGGGANPETFKYVYDDLDRLMTVEQPWVPGGPGETAVTSYAYDVQDHLTKVTDAEGNVTDYTYSDRDLMTEQDSPVSGVTAHQYNQHGVLIYTQDARAVEVDRTVDELDRVQFVDYTDSTLDIEYVYGDDPGAANIPFSFGRLIELDRDGELVRFTYDRFGRMLQDGDLTYEYDANGNRELITYPLNIPARSTFDHADRQATMVLEVGGGQTLASGASYLANGPLTTLTLGNGLVETRLFDGRYFPDRITAGGLLDWDYTTDDVGNVTSIVDGGTVRTYDYRNYQYYLTQGDGPWGTRAWTYDKIGNRLTEATGPGVTDTYTYLQNNLSGNHPQIDTIGFAGGLTLDYAYDVAGNRTQTAGGGQVKDFGYDDASRLELLTEGATPSTTLTYDGRNFLRRSLHQTANPANNARTEPTYSSEGVLMHHKRTVTTAGGEGLPHHSYVFYFSGRPVAIVEVDENSSGNPTNPSLIHLTTDHLGTPMLATSVAGAELWEGGFEPFGEDWNGAQGAGVFLRFPGQWEDLTWENPAIESGLYQNVNRWFDQDSGTYNRRDPLFETSSAPELSGLSPILHEYLYVQNRTSVLTDPLGLKPTADDRVNCILFPYGCIVSQRCRTEAVQMARRRFGFNGRNDASDAFRHCYWSCCIAKKVGSKTAETITTGHENFPENPLCEQRMDLANNTFGRGTGPKGPQAACGDHCSSVPLVNQPAGDCCASGQYIPTQKAGSNFGGGL